MRDDAPSDTAILIAKSLLLLSRDPEKSLLVHPEEVGLLHRMIVEAEPTSVFEWLSRRQPGRAILFGFERLLLNGIQLHYACRKRWIEARVRAALATGVRQVVIAAAGFDLLGWRLSREFPDVDFFELDHQATQRPKRKVLGSQPGLHFIPVDLAAQGIREALAGHPLFVEEQPKVCIAEGLLMYFGEERVAGLLAALSSIAGQDGSVVFTYMEKDASGSIDFRGQSPLVRHWLGNRREPFRWGIASEDLAEFLDHCELRISEVAGDDAFRRRFLEPAGLGRLPLARGECVCHSIPF